MKKAQYHNTIELPRTSEKAGSLASNGQDKTFSCLVLYKISEHKQLIF